jgi:ParB-like chromosome segregation protein Spo0J
MEAKVKITDIPTRDIEPNPTNPNRMDDASLKALAEDIEQRGFVQPILVRPITKVAGEKPMHVADCPMTKSDPVKRYTCICQHYEADERITPEGGVRFRIIDGEHRWRVLGHLGAETVPCVVDDTTATDAEVRMLTMNRLRGEFVPIRLAHLLADLAQRVDRSEIQSRLAMKPSELTELLNMGDYVKPVSQKPPAPPPSAPKAPTKQISVAATPDQADMIRRLTSFDENEQADMILEAARAVA